jgi:hypothetical protein
MASSSVEEKPKSDMASFVNTAATLSTSELKNIVESLQEVLSEREIQSYDLVKNGLDALVGLDKTKIKLVPLKNPSGEYTTFVEKEGGVFPDKTKGWIFHVGSGAFEMQYAWQESVIAAGTEVAQRSVFAFGPALLSAGRPEHVREFSHEIRSGFGSLVKQLNKDCGDIAPWKWDAEKALQLVFWASELSGETDIHLKGVIDDAFACGVDDSENDGDEYDKDENDEDEDDDEEVV